MIITTSTTGTKLRRAALAAGAVLALAACGGSEEATDEVNEPAAGAAAAGDSVVSTVSTSEGDVLTSSAGLSLYGFTPDAGGTPTCVDGCAPAWPPLTVDGDVLPEGLDPAVFSLVTHPDGSTQLAAGGWPLYLFAGDAAPGEINGQGSGGNWFLASPDGSLLGAPADAISDEAIEEGQAVEVDPGY